jgi:hypothetical protein
MTNCFLIPRRCDLGNDRLPLSASFAAVGGSNPLSPSLFPALSNGTRHKLKRFREMYAEHQVSFLLAFEPRMFFLLTNRLF